jgi:hypothetical protein
MRLGPYEIGLRRRGRHGRSVQARDTRLGRDLMPASKDAQRAIIRVQQPPSSMRWWTASRGDRPVDDLLRLSGWYNVRVLG